ncbi:MAG: hypothetical protein KBD01_01730 [Acidobacteria bacterium]|nr:hypothetical protein [Acidobacteriota bacterium]
MADGPVGASPWKGALAIALVFALGAVFGAALGFAALHLHGEPAPPIGGRHGLHAGRDAPERLMRELELDPDQRERIEAILQRTRETIHETLEATHREIRTVLRPDQQERFDKMRPPGPEFLHEGRPRGRGPGPPPPPS